LFGKTKILKTKYPMPTVANSQVPNKFLSPYSSLLLFVVCLFVTAFTSLTDKYSEGMNLVPLMFFILGFTGLVLWGVLVFYKKRNPAKVENNKHKIFTTEKVVFFLISIGVVFRLIYILYTDVGVADISTQMRQHDVFYFGDIKNNYRHSSYIEWFYNNFSLPSVSPEGLRQYYHPPLHHFVSAMWMRLLTTLGASYNYAVESIQILTLFYSSACMLICAKIFEFLKFKGMAIILPMAIVCFHPTFIIMSGSVNNDMLSVVLAFGAVYATMVWYKNPNIKNIIVIALLIGGSMMSKLSGGLIAPAVAFVFLVVLIRNMKDKGAGKGFVSMLPQFAVFALICVPLGLWWRIRTASLFNVPLTYVPSLSETADQYLGEYSFFERLFTVPFESIKNVFVAWGYNGFDYNEYNPFLSLIKTAIFGEFTLFNIKSYDVSFVDALGNIFSHILFWSSIVITAFAIWGAIYSVVKKKYSYDLTLTVMFLLIGGVIFGNYVNFCFQYPFTCTQNFRYCVPLIIVGGVFVGILCNYIRKSKGQISNIMKWVFPAVVTVFCVSSAGVYILLGLV